MAISAVIIVRNEVKNIEACVASVSWADEVVVVDSGSTDATRDLAMRSGAKVFEREFDDFAAQKNFGIEKAAGEWILFIDADERVSRPLAGEILRAVAAGEHQGYYIPRTNIIFGREMKYGGHRGDKHLRLFRKDAARFEGIIHEKAV
ncbi:MAG: glycosyltransferase family 2 protein, partial [Candidatus Omnitrophota bacterium]